MYDKCILIEMSAWRREITAVIHSSVGPKAGDGSDRSRCLTKGGVTMGWCFSHVLYPDMVRVQNCDIDAGDGQDLTRQV